MAFTNADKPSGFRPVGHLLGLPWNGALMTCAILANDSTATFMYDLVQVGGSGDALGHTFSVIQGVHTQEDNVGSIVAFGNTLQLAADVTDLSRVYRPAATLMYCSVVVDPYVIFEAQEDSASGSLAVTGIGRNVDIATVGSGDTTTGLSAMELDSSSVNTTGTIKLLGIVNREDNILGTNCKWNTLISEHAFGANTAVGT